MAEPTNIPALPSWIGPTLSIVGGTAAIVSTVEASIATAKFRQRVLDMLTEISNTLKSIEESIEGLKSDIDLNTTLSDVKDAINDITSWHEIWITYQKTPEDSRAETVFNDEECEQIKGKIRTYLNTIHDHVVGNSPLTVAGPWLNSYINYIEKNTADYEMPTSMAEMASRYAQSLMDLQIKGLHLLALVDPEHANSSLIQWFYGEDSKKPRLIEQAELIDGILTKTTSRWGLYGPTDPIRHTSLLYVATTEMKADPGNCIVGWGLARIGAGLPPDPSGQPDDDDNADLSTINVLGFYIDQGKPDKHGMVHETTRKYTPDGPNQMFEGGWVHDNVNVLTSVRTSSMANKVVTSIRIGDGDPDPNKKVAWLRTYVKHAPLLKDGTVSSESTQAPELSSDGMIPLADFIPHGLQAPLDTYGATPLTDAGFGRKLGQDQVSPASVVGLHQRTFAIHPLNYGGPINLRCVNRASALFLTPSSDKVDAQLEVNASPTVALSAVQVTGTGLEEHTTACLGDVFKIKTSSNNYVLVTSSTSIQLTDDETKATQFTFHNRFSSSLKNPLYAGIPFTMQYVNSDQSIGYVAYSAEGSGVKNSATQTDESVFLVEWLGANN